MSKSGVRLAAAWLVAAALALVPSRARAQTALENTFGGPVGFGTQCLSPNDDGSSDPIDLSAAFPAGLRFFSGMYRSAFVNTNGNITFGAALSTYTPDAFPVADQPMIAPYWADVDIRPGIPGCGGYQASTGSPGNAPCQNPRSNGVWWHVEPGRLIVTWHEVGYFSCHVDHRMNFQLTVTDAGLCGAAGDFDVEFRYNACGWTTGDASGGTDGFGGTPAQAGFDAGDLMHFFAVPGSLMPNINTLLCTGSNVGTPGLWRFAIRSGVVTMGGGTQSCGVGACVRTVPVCASGVPVTCTPGAPSPEVCNHIDDDCNGVVDDGQTTCGVGACVRTVPLCTAGVMTPCVPGAPTTEVCNGIDDNCNGTVDEGCGDVTVVVTPDASDECHENRCFDPLLLEGRAGPIGNCACRSAGRPAGRGGVALAALAAVLALGGRRRRAVPKPGPSV